MFGRVLLYLKTEMEWDRIYEVELLVEVNGVQFEEWEKRYPGVFEKGGQYGKNDFLRKLKVCHKGIEWKLNPVDIPRANTGVTYNIAEVSDKEPVAFVKKLEEEGIVSKLQVSEKAFFSLVMFLPKADQIGVRKVVDFRLLNAYARTWKTHFPGTLATVRMIPAD